MIYVSNNWSDDYLHVAAVMTCTWIVGCPSYV